VLDWVQTDGERAWTAPSTSPENHYLDEHGTPRAIGETAVMDAELVRGLADACGQAAAVLERDDPWVDELIALAALLPPLAVNAKGTLSEWAPDRPEVDAGHRHLSHLVGLFPVGSITPDRTPDLARGAAGA